MTIDSTRFNYFDASLISKSDLKLLEKVDSAFDRMFKEIAIVGEYERQNKLHLVEFALSKRTRKVLNELKHKEIQFTTQYKALLEYIEEQEASAGDTTNDAADIGGNILKLINKFHTDNKKSIDTLSGEEKFKDFVPKNIGAEPSIWQKAKAKLQGVASGDGNVIVKLLTAIVSGAMDKAEKFFSGLKGDLAAAWKGGGTEVDSQGNPIIDPATGQPKKTADGVAGVFQYAMTSFGPSMTTVERGADGQLVYKKDTEATGFIDWLRKFVERNPKWTNIIIGFITNIAKIIALPFGGPMSSVIAGAVVGLILRTLVGRLKGESWAQAFKQAAIVVGLSLIAGAVFKGLVAWIRGGGFFAGIKSYFVGGDPVAAAKAAAADAKANAAGKAARKTAQAAEVQQFIDSRSRDAAQQLLKTTDSWQLRQLGSDIPDDAWRAAGWDNVPYQDGDKAAEFYRLVNNAKSGDQKYVDVVTKLIRSSPKLTNSIDYKELPPSSQRLIAGLVSGKPQLLNPKELQSAMLDAQAETAAQQQAAQGATATMKAGAAAVNAANFAKVSTDDITKLMATKGANTKLIDVIYKTPSLLKAFKEQASETVQGGDVRTYITRVADPEEIADIINKAGGLPKETLGNLAIKSAANLAAPIDMSTVTTSKIAGLTSQLHNAFPNDTPPSSDQLLNFFTKKGLSVEDAKYLAKTITGGDSASRAEKFRDLWRMGQGDTSVLNAVKGLGDLPKNQYDALVGQSGITANVAGGASTAVLQNINDNSVANAIKALGPSKFGVAVTGTDGSWLQNKFIPAVEKFYNLESDPLGKDSAIKTIVSAAARGDAAALKALSGALKASGGLPMSYAQNTLEPDQIQLLGPLVVGSTVKESSYKKMMKNIYL